jgi:hypothetical protein
MSMKVILLLQSLIIIVGAVYWYVEIRPATNVPPNVHKETVGDIQIPASTTPITPVVSTDEPEELYNGTSSVQYDPAGPNDAGMEYPTFDPEIQPQL